MCFSVNNRRKANFVTFKLQVMNMYFVKTNELRMDVYAYTFQHGNYTQCLMVAASQWVRTPTFEYGIMYMILLIVICITCSTIICRTKFHIVYGLLISGSLPKYKSGQFY